MILAPVIITWSTGLRQLRHTTLPAVVEGSVFVAALLLASFVTFKIRPPGSDWSPALLYAPLPFLLWAAVRFGPRGTSMAILIVALLSIWNAVHERGPFAAGTPDDNALTIQLFLIMVSVPLLTLAAVMKERQHAAAALHESRERLNLILEAILDQGPLSLRARDRFNESRMSDTHPLVYVVDDEEPVRKALSRLLAASGLQVHTFSNGPAFLDAALREAPDCVVLDLHMPGLTGLDVLLQMTNSGLNVPSIVITAHDAPESKALCMSAGAVEYLCKPIDASALLDAIARVARTST